MTATHTTSRARIAELAATCVHCGFCLSACPTYAVTRAEADSPRGRIWLLAEEATRSGPVVADRVRLHIDRCIGCEACVPACPSGVRYDEIIHLARGLVEPGRPLADRTWRRSLARLFPSARASAAALALGRPLFALRPALARGGGFGRRVARALDEGRVADRRHGGQPRITSSARSPRRRVLLLAGCVASAALGSTNDDAVSVLEAEGYSVEVLESVCCGALSEHAGDEAAARRHARRIMAALADRDESVRLVVTSAGCGAHLRRYEWIVGEEGAAVARATIDITELLTEDAPRAPRGAIEARVAVHDACHLAFAQGIVDAPRALLRQIPGLELVDVGGPRCCGAGGLYSLLEPELSTQVGERKARAVTETAASVVASPNPGCTLQLRALLGPEVDVVHPVTLVARSIEAARRGATPRR
ncbi:protein of unknown function DUF224 cysteine-rich region domain protein [Acidimicrobium ferrooxidans DSM 10331]|uniref:Glycolate oxidase iron-sulfur subunit n=1 Tax=Acidimicrobium ferrooxidans (strain DSM 10331 / JCM 15462 / NBRC 103882 / ICP) TaxID=525909 RepID=C7LZX8_ACIFD|nr:(Fe-S)-binding protein [Acidimicrobium ferrooxidans]ACU54286.1 protein of unknown function DUF224 cysteine-rich region domain protein [Acidimicrobium ferrooxidans DSM 10331]